MGVYSSLPMHGLDLLSTLKLPIFAYQPKLAWEANQSSGLPILEVDTLAAVNMPGP